MGAGATAGLGVPEDGAEAEVVAEYETEASPVYFLPPHWKDALGSAGRKVVHEMVMHEALGVVEGSEGAAAAKDGDAAPAEPLPPLPSVPRSVEDREECCASMRALVKGDFERWYPEVLVTFADGRGEGDAKGCGPGLGFCRSLCQHLAKHDIRTYSHLHAPEGTNWKEFILRLNSRFAKCKVLIVVVTAALFDDLSCMREIFNGLKSPHGLKILPVLFDSDDIPWHPLDQWTNVSTYNAHDSAMVRIVRSREYDGVGVRAHHRRSTTAALADRSSVSAILLRPFFTPSSPPLRPFFAPSSHPLRPLFAPSSPLLRAGLAGFTTHVELDCIPEAPDVIQRKPEIMHSSYTPYTRTHARMHTFNVNLRSCTHYTHHTHTRARTHARTHTRTHTRTHAPASVASVKRVMNINGIITPRRSMARPHKGETITVTTGWREVR